MIGQTTDPSRPSRPTFAAIGSRCAVTVPARFASTGPADALSSVQLRAAGAATRNAATMKKSAVMRIRDLLAPGGTRSMHLLVRMTAEVRETCRESAQVFVRLHVEPHREERELRSRD